MNQEDLAGIIDGNKALIANYESGRNFPTIPRLVKLADFFEVSLDNIIKCDFSKEKINYHNPPATIQQNNNGGIGNTNMIHHTESEWAGMQQRITDLEAIIELQKKYIARLESDVEKNN